MTIAAPVFFRPESSPENGMDSESIEIVRGDDAADSDFRPVADVERSSGDAFGDKPVHQRGLFLKVEKVRPGNIGVTQVAFAFSVAFRFCSRKRHHSLLVGYSRKGTKQYSFHPPKNGGIGADSEREAKNGEKRKAAIPVQHAESKAKVLEKIFDEIDVTHFAAFLLALFQSTQ